MSPNHEPDRSVTVVQYAPVNGYGIHRRIQNSEFAVDAFFSPHNSRIRVIRYKATNYTMLAQTLIMSAVRETLGKIFVKVSPKDAERFRLVGFREEATIPGYFNGKDAKVMSYFADETRSVSSLSSSIRAEVDAAVSNVSSTAQPELPPGYSCRPAREEDAEALAALFRTNFESYPFPVFDKTFVLKTMRDNVHYQVIAHNGELVAVASGDVQPKYCCAEMTDFATLPSHRGKGFAHILLAELEKKMARLDIRSLHTLARACSPAINRTFAKMGYCLTGTLIRNCNISGRMEDMNCWGKVL
ncbi:MAG: putative beta-lysine N-acetyltransferase [Deltaproteobacteria bacterium]|nr:putative beta-lysine N-acetyltransferase [Deltaproteobacteria bacterium]MBN2671281.1 putative beta-lysine N-acetyltransferase [Deltaproteobacteria bacterium]